MLTQEHGYVLAIEYLCNIKVTKTIQYLRVLFDEVTRLLNHLMALTTHALDVGALTPFLWGFEEREKLMGLYEAISGARMHAVYYRPNSLSWGISPKVLNNIYYFTKSSKLFLEDLESLLTNNNIWVQRLENVGVLSKYDALSLGFSGPLLRSTGVPWDLRKTQPYEIYKNLRFFVPTGSFGDCYTRYLIRVEEMKQSVILVQQCLEFFHFFNNNNNTLTKKTKYLWLTPNKRSLKTGMEELISHFYTYGSGINITTNSTYTVIEAPKGETGVYLFSDGGCNPFRCKIKSPGFLHLQGLEMLSKSHLLADLVTNIGTQDIVFGEIDR